MPRIITFSTPDKPNGWMSNEWVSDLIYNGLTFKSAEHMIQYFRFPWDSSVKNEILAATSPREARSISRRNAASLSLIPLCGSDLDNIKIILCSKLEKNQQLGQFLLATGQDLIVFNTTGIQSSVARKLGASLINNTWRGTNVLGKIWMAIRDCLLPTVNQEFGPSNRIYGQRIDSQEINLPAA